MDGLNINLSRPLIKASVLQIANGCGQRNMFMYPYNCRIIPDSTPAKTIGSPQPPVWCEDDQSKCVKGPKQILVYDQLEGNNINVEGNDLSGEAKTPGYNMKCGFSGGTYRFDLSPFACVMTDSVAWVDRCSERHLRGCGH